MSRYDRLLIDVHNIAHRVFKHKSETSSYVSKKKVYKQAIANFIRTIEALEKQFLHSDGEIYLLFDNPTSRVDLQSSFYFSDRKLAYAKYKEDRSKEPKEFYNSIALIKYYYLVAEPKYRTIQINRLEADDLVDPCLKLYCDDCSVLLVSNDLDWVRYLNNYVHWLPKLNGEPETTDILANRLGFPITETSLVTYKALFGDVADNIPAVIKSSYKSHFNELLDQINTPDDVAMLSKDNSMLERFPLLHGVRENERQYRINIQLIKAIPVAEKHLRYTTTTGRNSTPVKKAIQTAIGLESSSNTFVFGNIKRPRTC